MKKLMMVLLAAATSVTVIFAQPPAPVDGINPPPPPPGAPARDKRPPRGAGQQLQQVSTFQGKVVKMVTNDDYVYDGFYLLNGSDSSLVKFPPHLGSQVTAALKTGSTVSVSGVANINPMGTREIRFLSITANGKSITDAAPVAFTTPPVAELVKGSGKISSLLTDREGRVNGFMIGDKTILKFGPGAIAQLLSMAQTGSAISYTGMQKSTAQGEVSSGDYSIVRCKTITVNGQQYLVQ